MKTEVHLRVSGTFSWFLYSHWDNETSKRFLKRLISWFAEQQLKLTCLDLIIAGSKTTSNTIEFAILCLLQYQDIQEKLYNEINTVIGDTTPCYDDHNRFTHF